MLTGVSFVMVEPSHPGNVGSAARAIKTMGFHDLILVNPRHEAVLSHPDAIALASGAVDVLERAQVYATLQEALGSITLSFALTARHRDLGPPVSDMRAAALTAGEHLQAHLHEGGRVAIVVGTERSGLTNEQVSLCNWICHIPANPDYSSLNVAQALQLAAYELRYSLLRARPELLVPSSRQTGEPAAGAAVDALLTHWEQAMIAIGFLDPAHPKKLMPRMRHLFAKAALTREETDLLRGVCTAMIARCSSAHARS